MAARSSSVRRSTDPDALRHRFTISVLCLTDMFVQPINLGWHTPRADATVAYGLYLPTGRYEDGASDNTGLGMWGQELLMGHDRVPERGTKPARGNDRHVQLPFGEEGQQHESGEHPQPEGRVGADFLGGGLSDGLAYYGTFKLTEDRFEAALPTLLIRGKNRVWALGPELTLAIAANRTVYGFVTVRYQWEMGARTTTEGAAWNIMATFPLKPIHLP